jgi:hypothetical protein
MPRTARKPRKIRNSARKVLKDENYKQERASKIISSARGILHGVRNNRIEVEDALQRLMNLMYPKKKNSILEFLADFLRR